MNYHLKTLKDMLLRAQADRGFIGSAIAEDAFKNLCGWLYVHHEETKTDTFRDVQTTVVDYVRMGGGSSVG